MTEKFLDKLKNILICYSIRNTSVGYCQGMNFIGGRLLLIMGSEEQTFWLFIQIMEKILSIIYYSELVGIVVETTIIENLISFYFPKLNEFFIENNFNVPLRNFIHKWMVGLFTQTLSPEMVYTFFDFLFLDGRDLLINNSLFIMSFIHDKLINNNNIEFMYNLFNEGLLNIHDTKTMIYFLGLKTLKNIKNYRKKLEKSIISKVKKEEELDYNEEKNKNRINSLKQKGIICNPNWPTCLFDDYTQKVIEVLVLKEKKIPSIINDYYYIKNKNYPDNYPVNNFNRFNKYDKEPLSTSKEVLIERHKHICDNAILVDSSKILVDEEYMKIEFDFINWNKDDDNKIYDKLKNSEEFDNLVNEIKNDMKKSIKPIKINDINILIEKNEKDEKYYPDNYIFHILEK